MKARCLLLLLLPAAVSAQKINFNAGDFKNNLLKKDSIKMFIFPKVTTGVTSNGYDIHTIAATKVISSKLNTKFHDLLKKLNINLNPAHPAVDGNYLGCCNCCTEATVKTFSAVGEYTFSPNNTGFSTTSVTLDLFANVQYLVRITGMSNQARNFTVSFGAALNTQGFTVPAGNFDITFIAKPATSGNFYFSWFSNEPGLWAFYNCSVTEL